VYVVYETIILSVCLSEGRSQKASDDRAGGRAGPARAGAETDERPTDDDDANAGREYVTHELTTRPAGRDDDEKRMLRLTESTRKKTKHRV
jgi:hypothetical protein